MLTTSFVLEKKFASIKTCALEGVELMSPLYNSKIIALSINQKPKPLELPFNVVIILKTHIKINVFWEVNCST